MNTKAKILNVFTAKVKDVDKVWFTSSEACKYLGMSARGFRDLRNSGRLKFYSMQPDNIHARVYVNKHDMDKLFKPVTL